MYGANANGALAIAAAAAKINKTQNCSSGMTWARFVGDLLGNT